MPQPRDSVVIASPTGVSPPTRTEAPPLAPTGTDPAVDITSSIAVIARHLQQEQKDTDALIHKTHKQTSELVASTHTQVMKRIQEVEGTIRTLTQFADVIPRGMAECNRLLSRTETLIGRAEEIVRSIQSAQKQLDDVLVRETAAATGARRELWTEAARFRDQIGWQLRWFIRTPAILLALTALLTATWLLLRPRAVPLKRSPEKPVLTAPVDAAKAVPKKPVPRQQPPPEPMNAAP